MKQIASLSLYFLAGPRLLAWLVGGGLACLSGGIVLAYAGSGKAYDLVYFSCVLIFGLPYFILPGTFRHLITRRRHCMLPGFHLKAGLALLLVTVLLSIFMPAVTQLTGIKPVSWASGILTFVLASVYMGYMQLSITSRYSPYLIGVGAWMIAISVFYSKTRITSFGILDSLILLPLFGLTLAGWAWALYQLASRNEFKRTYLLLGEGESFKRLWQSHDKHPQSSTTAGTLLLGFPDGFRQLLQGGAMWILVFPMICAGIFSFFDLLAPGNPLPTFSWSFLTLSAVLGAWSSAASGELAARARLLWLRYGADRPVLWGQLEKVVFRNQVCIYFWAMGVTVLLPVIGVFEAGLMGNYLLFVISVSQFQLYLSLYGRIADWPNPVKGVNFLLCMGLLAFAASTGFTSGNYLTLNCLEALLLFLALVLRTLARNNFLDIDWFRVQPISLARIRGDL